MLSERYRHDRRGRFACARRAERHGARHGRSRRRGRAAIRRAAQAGRAPAARPVRRVRDPGRAHHGRRQSPPEALDRDARRHPAHARAREAGHPAEPLQERRCRASTAACRCSTSSPPPPVARAIVDLQRDLCGTPPRGKDRPAAAGVADVFRGKNDARPLMERRPPFLANRARRPSPSRRASSARRSANGSSASTSAC